MATYTTIDIQAGIEAAKEDFETGLLNHETELTPERLTDFQFGYQSEATRLLGGGE